LRTGAFDIRGPLGQKFQAAHKKGSAQHSMYNQSKGFKEKTEFRLKWAREQYDDIVMAKRHTQSYKVVNQSLGTYKPFAVLVQDEGGKDDPEALNAAKKIASKCVALGGDWVSWNVMSERLEFLHLRREHNEIMSNKWELYLEETQKVQRAPASSRCARPRQPQQDSLGILGGGVFRAVWHCFAHCCELLCLHGVATGLL